MPDQSTILSLPLILPAQAQKHVTHNEALRLLDVMVQLAVINRTLTVAPALPAIGDRHIVAAGATGVWAGRGNAIALFTTAGWEFFTPLAGWLAYVLADAAPYAFSGTAWVAVAGGGGGGGIPASVPGLGFNTSYDLTNRLAVSSPATLLSHEGAGHQVKVNKAVAADTASLLFQTGFSGRAEMGTAGGDDFSVKVSADGSSFANALTAAAATGRVTLHQPAILAGQANDPASPANGTIWHNATTGQIKAQLGGAAYVLDRQGVNPIPFLLPVVGETVMTTTGAGGGNTGTTAGAANRTELFPYMPRMSFAVDQAIISCTTAVAAAVGKVVIYSSDAFGRPDQLIAETADINLATTGFKPVALVMNLAAFATYWVGVRHSSTATVSAWGAGATPDLNGGAASGTARKTVRRTLTYATAAPTTWGYLSSEVSGAVAPAIWLRVV